MLWPLAKIISPTIIAKGPGRGENRRDAAYATQGTALSFRSKIFLRTSEIVANGMSRQGVILCFFEVSSLGFGIAALATKQ